MPSFRQKFALAGISSFLIVACSSNVGIPSLPRRDQPIDRILLRGSVEPKDIRLLFRTLNENGNLNSLKPWLENASDEELRMIGSFIGRYFYEDAYQRDGLRSLLDLRLSRKGFTQWENAAKQTPELSSFVSLLSLKDLPTLISRDVPFLSRDFYETSLKLRTSTSTSVSPEAMASEGIRFLGVEENQKKLIPLTRSLIRSEFGTSLLRALNELGEKYKNNSPFRGFARSLKKNLNPEANRWDDILNFVKLLNRPTNGLFLEAQENLKQSDDLARQLEMKMRPKVAAAVATYLRPRYSKFDAAFWKELPRKSPNDPPTANFLALFTQTRESVEKVISLELAEEEPFLYQRRVILNSLVLTEWMEAFVIANPGITLSEKSSYQFPIFEFELKGATAGTLSERAERDLKAIGGKEIEPFLEDLAKFLTLKGTGKTEYTTTAPTEKTPFAVGLRAVVTSFDRTLAFGDPTPLFATLFSGILHPEHPLDLSLAALETDADGSMLRSVHRFLGALTYDGLERFFHLIFDELQLGDLAEDDRQVICGVFPTGSDNARFCLKTLESIKLIPLFNQRIDGLPSLVETYHALLTYTIPKRSGGAEDLLSFLATSKMFASPEGKPIYPTVIAFFQNEDLITEILFCLSRLSDDEQVSFLTPIVLALEERHGVSGTRLHLKALGEMKARNPQKLQQLVTYAIRRGWAFLPTEDTLTFNERASLERITTGEDLAKLIPFLQTHGSVVGGRQLLREIRVLSRNGALKHAFQLLGQTEDERLRLIATTLLKWETSGEFNAFINTVDTLLGG